MKELLRSAKYFIAYKIIWVRRILQWKFSGIKYSGSVLSYKTLSVMAFEHQSVLLRKLRGVDMWMQHNKVVNLQMACGKLNGILIHPGGTFSYWKLIGEPNKQKGYLKGMVLKDGGFESGVGGGLCQLSNLIYWIILHSPLTVTERWRHTYDVFPDENRKVPFGAGATCSFPLLDLQFKNNTDQTFQLVFEITDTHLIGKLLCEKDILETYEIIEENHKMESDFSGNFYRSNEIYKIISDKLTKKLLQKEFITSNKAKMMYSPFLK